MSGQEIKQIKFSYQGMSHVSEILHDLFVQDGFVERLGVFLADEMEILKKDSDRKACDYLRQMGADDRKAFSDLARKYGLTDKDMVLSVMDS